ncbi:MAG: bifunctional UDP-N-acetylglucosamine diphosphorylase/glucosamine-1-phosphate N-acetyltransferase GlmU [Rhodospirillales bacterium]|nr:bifunctional UDP-N-acetylglucosamine diphosphorylase/glucosamine-1-phosphate N-acetyltransferase GlmU [Rhodospirillales bacterium]
MDAPESPLAIVILAAGQGTRMQSALPKVLHPIAGRPMIAQVLAVAERLAPAKIVTVVAPGMDRVTAAVAPHPTAVQTRPLGTAHALLAAAEVLADDLAAGADVLVLYGDGPLIAETTLSAMLAKRRDADFVWLAVRPPDPTGYGRLIREEGKLQRIVEEKDASPEERREGLVWGGLLAGRGRRLFELASRIDNRNAKGEFYLTALVSLGNEAGAVSTLCERPLEEVLGVNSRRELAAAEAVMQRRLRLAAMENGVTLVAPESVIFSWDTRLAADVTVEANVVFGPGVTVAGGSVIRSFSHLEGVSVGANATVGPFARLRPGTELGDEVHIGNFVEVKASHIECGAKANHLSYIGDATVGAAANIGAGTVTANYNGVYKSRSEIGAGASVGSNTVLVAPVRLGAGAIAGAGSVLTEDVPDGAIAVARAKPSVTPRAAERYRARLRKEKIR